MSNTQTFPTLPAKAKMVKVGWFGWFVLPVDSRHTDHNHRTGRESKQYYIKVAKKDASEFVIYDGTRTPYAFAELCADDTYFLYMIHMGKVARLQYKNYPTIQDALLALGKLT